MFEMGSVDGVLASAFWEAISHNWALISILLTLLVLTFVPALVLLKYVRICLNILRDTEPPLSMSQFGFTPLMGSDVDFFAADGVRLRGTLLRAHAPAPRGLVLFAPEFKSDRRSCAKYCRHLLEAGYDIFTFDFRGHGDSAPEAGYTPRQWASDREMLDMNAAISYAEQWLEEQGRPIELGLFGISRGACTALLAAETNASVRAIVCDGAFSSDGMLEHLMKRWAKIFARVRVVYENHPPEFWRFLRWCLFVSARFKLKCRFPSVRKALVRMIPRPILFIHGERDSYIPVEHSQLLYAQSAQPKYLWIVPRAKHNQPVDLRPDEYGRRTVQFFDRCLARRHDAENMYLDEPFDRRARRARRPVAPQLETLCEERPRRSEPILGAAAGDAGEMLAVEPGGSGYEQTAASHN